MEFGSFFYPNLVRSPEEKRPGYEATGEEDPCGETAFQVRLRRAKGSNGRGNIKRIDQRQRHRSENTQDTFWREQRFALTGF